MYIKNNQSESITNYYEGLEFTVQPGVSAIWDPAGEFFIERYKPVGEHFKPVTPAVTLATEEEWNGQYAEVHRFKMDWTRLPDRKYCITLAKQRGVPQTKIQDFIDNEEIDISQIVDAINKLPVSEEIRFPAKKLETVTA